jgi:hypothetical protein
MAKKKPVPITERQRLISEGLRLAWKRRKAANGRQRNVGRKKKDMPKDDSG